MTEIILFGGTTEGRVLCQLLEKKQIKTLACVATGYGEALLPSSETVRVHTGRLDEAAMADLLQAQKPRIVLDATHPYAAEVSGNIRAACEKAGVKRLRLLRETLDNDGCVTFFGMDQLIDWVNERPGVVFSALGAKEAAALSEVKDYRKRVWLRILPDEDGLSACLAAGFPARHIICMQGPFSKELNAAMFRETGAEILLTKESGRAGGFPEKLEAAGQCGMITSVLSRPREENGLTLPVLIKLIEEDAL